MLGEERVVLPSHYHPFVRVGRDYFGGSIMSLPEHRELEATLEQDYPKRFAEEPVRLDREFASHYAFELLEAAVARCTRDDDFGLDSRGVGDSLAELIAVLEAKSYTVTVCRVVSHVATTNGDELTVGDVLVVPERNGIRSFETLVSRYIPGATSVFNRAAPFQHNPPTAMLVVSETTDGTDPYEVAKRLSARLERFLLQARLLTGTTAQTFYELAGETTLISRMGTHFTQPEGDLDSPVRRVWAVDGTEAAKLAAVGELIDSAVVRREGMAMTTFDTAVRKFHLSFRGGDLYDQFVDLATALEATLVSSDKDTGAIGLRLRNRAAGLLAGDGDSAEAVFKDVGKLYGLRSSLVHGGSLRQADLMKTVKAISTVPEQEVERFFVIALGYALDRLRDIVRRAILARLCLAAPPDPVWTLDSKDAPIDRTLVDDVKRLELRDAWRTKLDGLGIAEAAEPQPTARSYFDHETER